MGTNLSSAFHSVQALSGLDEAHTRWEGQSTSLSPPIPKLISPRDTLTDTPRNNALSWHPMAEFRLCLYKMQPEL